LELLESISHKISDKLGKHYNDKNIPNISEIQLPRKDGELIWVELNVTFYEMEDTGNVIMIALFRNIEKRKKAEKLVQEKTLQLETTNATKDKFFSIIAHDLKNPLGSFREMSAMLNDNYDSFDDGERKEILTMLKSSSENLYLLLENLLEWSRAQRGLIQFNPINFELNFIANNCVELLKLSADKKRIKLVNNVASDFNIYADPNLITTIIRNLISNAIKFTLNDGIIEVGADMLTDQNTVKVYVKDSGIGMEQEIIDKLFRIDVNITSKGTSGESGTGLGLILCKEFVEKHNGKIWVESKIGLGSTFNFTLPIADNESSLLNQ